MFRYFILSLLNISRIIISWLTEIFKCKKTSRACKINEGIPCRLFVYFSSDPNNCYLIYVPVQIQEIISKYKVKHYLGSTKSCNGYLNKLDWFRIEQCKQIYSERYFCYNYRSNSISGYNTMMKHAAAAIKMRYPKVLTSVTNIENIRQN